MWVGHGSSSSFSVNDCLLFLCVCFTCELSLLLLLGDSYAAAVVVVTITSSSSRIT